MKENHQYLMSFYSFGANCLLKYGLKKCMNSGILTQWSWWSGSSHTPPPLLCLLAPCSFWQAWSFALDVTSPTTHIMKTLGLGTAHMRYEHPLRSVYVWSIHSVIPVAHSHSSAGSHQWPMVVSLSESTEQWFCPFRNSIIQSTSQASGSHQHISLVMVV